jgi:hypothetical protein
MYHISTLFLSLFPVAPTLEHRASMKRFVSLQFLNLKTVSRTPWMGDQPVARPLPIQTQNKHRQTSMPWVGFEPTIPAFKQTKTVHALDRAATVTGMCLLHLEKCGRKRPWLILKYYYSCCVWSKKEATSIIQDTPPLDRGSKLTSIYCAVFWDTTPCSLVGENQSFRRTYRLPSWRLPWRRRQHVPSKR